MWLNWLPWRFIIQHAARRKGLIDPISLLAQFDRFGKPAEVLAPLELIRAGIVVQARGMINNQAIQHNLDWVWPYWVEQQFDPRSPSFIPRAFSITHINITHRNWTAIGIPGHEQLPIVDPRGLITPHFDGWSMDFWIAGINCTFLLPSRLATIDQQLTNGTNLMITTRSAVGDMQLEVRCCVVLVGGQPCCRIELAASAPVGSLLVASVRPFNPEGVSFIDTISAPQGSQEITVNKKDKILFSQAPDQIMFSTYSDGDVFRKIRSPQPSTVTHIACPVGMATCAALFAVSTDSRRTVELLIPLSKPLTSADSSFTNIQVGAELWDKRMEGGCVLKLPDEKIQKLFTTALTTMVLHTPQQVYAGPYTYKRFWFRDAVLILYPMVVLGLRNNLEKLIHTMLARQKMDGYFMSQEGEWDSNGQVLWFLGRVHILTRQPLDPSWRKHIKSAVNWIRRKRHSSKYPGLMPAGFSAEHLGPNDNYYWDDFWSVAGLRAAAALLREFDDTDLAEVCMREAAELQKAILESLRAASICYEKPIMPSSPHRRMDSAAVANLVASYPLQLLSPDDPLVLNTVAYLFDNCFIDNALFHDISHSGINPYLTLHVAQSMLRAGDPRYLQIMHRIGVLASQTGQWPEGIHPQTGSGCMGDGQHVWAAAEWTMMVRNCFVREEEAAGVLVLGSGIDRAWLLPDSPILFGPTLTVFGSLTLKISTQGHVAHISWEAVWNGARPKIEVALCGAKPVVVQPDQNAVDVDFEGETKQ